MKGSYSVHVTVYNGEPVAQSPYTAYVVYNVPDAVAVVAFGDALTRGVAGILQQFTIQARSPPFTLNP